MKRKDEIYEKFVKIMVSCFALTLCVLFGASTADAAAPTKVIGVKQASGDTSSIAVECNTQLGFDDYYILQLSTDAKTWATVDYSSSCTGLRADGLNAGTTYYARVSLASDTRGENIYAGTCSDYIDVVTAPSASGLKVYQSNAATNAVYITGVGAYGANYNMVMDNGRVLGTSRTATVRVGMYAGSYIYPDYYPCRISSKGFIAKSSYGYTPCKSLMNKLGTGSIGITNIYENINVYYFDFSTSAKYDGYQWQFLTPSGKVLKTYSDTYRIANYINGKALKYRFRTYVNCFNGKNTYRKYSAWSDCKYIGYANKVSGKIYKKKYVRVKWSKMSNVSGYTIYTSTKKKSGFKKYKSLGSKTTSIIIKKVAGKSIKKRKTYYVRIIPKMKSGKKTYNAGGYVQYQFRIY